MFYNINGANWSFNLPWIEESNLRIFGTKNVFPRLPAETVDRLEKSVIQLEPIINEITNKLVPQFEDIFNPAPKWFK